MVKIEKTKVVNRPPEGPGGTGSAGIIEDFADPEREGAIALSLNIF
jgi:hypothetical protein